MRPFLLNHLSVAHLPSSILFLVVSVASLSFGNNCWCQQRRIALHYFNRTASFTALQHYHKHCKIWCCTNIIFPVSYPIHFFSGMIAGRKELPKGDWSPCRKENASNSLHWVGKKTLQILETLFLYPFHCLELVWSGCLDCKYKSGKQLLFGQHN